MRYLRMLTNAVLAGALAAVYIAIVFLQVNPHTCHLICDRCGLYSQSLSASIPCCSLGSFTRPSSSDKSLLPRSCLRGGSVFDCCRG